MESDSAMLHAHLQPRDRPVQLCLCVLCTVDCFISQHTERDPCCWFSGGGLKGVGPIWCSNAPTLPASTQVAVRKGPLFLEVSVQVRHEMSGCLRGRIHCMSGSKRSTRVTITCHSCIAACCLQSESHRGYVYTTGLPYIVMYIHYTHYYGVVLQLVVLQELRLIVGAQHGFDQGRAGLHCIRKMTY